MTLFTKLDCQRCDLIKKQYDLAAMDVRIEVLDNDNAEALAHLAWHGLVETARKTLPILVLDDCSAVDDFERIGRYLDRRAEQYGIAQPAGGKQRVTCESGSCALA